LCVLHFDGAEEHVAEHGAEHSAHEAGGAQHADQLGMRSVGQRVVTNVMDAPYAPAIAQQKLMRSA